jgi:hypothetical protein
LFPGITRKSGRRMLAIFERKNRRLADHSNCCPPDERKISSETKINDWPYLFSLQCGLTTDGIADPFTSPQGPLSSMRQSNDLRDDDWVNFPPRSQFKHFIRTRRRCRLRPRRGLRLLLRVNVSFLNCFPD